MLIETDLAFRIQSLLKNKTSVLDVGCGFGKDLFPFLDLGFTDLHGIDNSNIKYKFLPYFYVKYKFNYADTVLSEPVNNKGRMENMKTKKDRMDRRMVQYNWPALYREFETYKFDVGDVLNYKFDKTYDLIIIKNVIHFFDQESRIELLSKLVNFLNEDGILYVYANSLKRMKGFRDLSNLIWLSHKSFKEAGPQERIFHLLDGDDFLEIEKLLGKLNLNFKIDDREDRLGEEIIIRKTKSIEI